MSGSSAGPTGPSVDPAKPSTGSASGHGVRPAKQRHHGLRRAPSDDRPLAGRRVSPHSGSHSSPTDRPRQGRSIRNLYLLEAAAAIATILGLVLAFVVFLSGDNILNRHAEENGDVGERAVQPLPAGPSSNRQGPLTEPLQRMDSVTLTVDDVAAAEEISVTTVVREMPPPGHAYFLLLTVHHAKPEGYVEYYTRAKLSSDIGQRQRTVLAFPYYVDLSVPRKVQVVSVTPQQAQPMLAQLSTHPDDTVSLSGWPCARCAVSAAAEITPR